MGIPIFRIPAIKQICQLIQEDDYSIPFDKHHQHVLHLVGQNKSYQYKVLPYGLATSPRIYTSLSKPRLFFPAQGLLYFCLCEQFMVWFVLNMLAKG